MIYNIKDLKNGQKVWACAYNTNNNEKTMALKKKPVYGEIFICIEDFEKSKFYEIDRNGNIKKSSSVLINSRQYTDTKEECIMLYNELINNQIFRLQQLIKECKKDIINCDER